MYATRIQRLISFAPGIVTICQGVVKTPGQLQAMRFLLGLFESGFFPGCTYLISMYYKRYELQWRFNIFFTGSILAGSFSGLLAYAIAHMDGTAGYSGWRWCVSFDKMHQNVEYMLMHSKDLHFGRTIHCCHRHTEQILHCRLARDLQVPEWG